MKQENQAIFSKGIKQEFFFKVRLLTVCEHRTFLLRIYKDCFRFTLVEKL